MRSPTRLRAIVLCLVCLLTVAGSTAYGQSPQVTFVTPTNGMQNVSVNPTITVTTSFPIDASSLQFLSSYREESTVYDYGDLTLTLIPKDIHDSLPDSLWHYVAAMGTYSTPSSTTIEFVPSGLPYGETFYCHIKGLRVIDGVDTLIVPDTSISFRTVELLPSVLSSSLDQMSDMIRCNDKVSVKFSKKMASHTTMSGNLLELAAVTGATAVIDTFYTKLTSAPIMATSWVDPSDSTIVWIQPSTSLTAGGMYILSIYLSRITGDSLDNREQVFHVRDTWRLNVSVVSTGTLTSLPDGCYPDVGVGDIYLPASTATFSVSVPAIVDSARFKAWFCPQDPSVMLVTTPTLTFSQSCGSLLDRDITALYEKIPQVTVTVVADPSGRGDVYVVDEGASLGYPGNYSVYKQGDDRLVVSAFPSSGNVFVGWVSSNPVYNGASTATVIVKNPTANMTLQPVFIAAAACPSHSVCVSVMDEFGLPLPPGVVFVTPNPCAMSGVPFTANVFASIVGGTTSCYRIVGVVASNNFIWPTPPWDWNFSSNVSFGPVGFTTTPTNCNIQVTIIVAKRSYILTEEIAITGNKDLPTPAYNQVINNTVVPQGIRLGSETVTAKVVTRRWQYKCGTVVTLTPWTKQNGGYTTDYWQCGAPYTCNNIIDLPRNILQLTMDQDWRVRHYFRVGEFRVLQVGFKNMSGTIDWYSVDAFPRSNIMLPANSGKTVELYVRFNLDVKIGSVPGNLRARDISERIDRCDKLLRNYAFEVGTGSWSGELYDLKTVKFTLRTGTASGFSTYMENTELVIGAGIESATNLPLTNPKTVYFETRLPGVLYTLSQLHVGNNGDGPSAEIYTENIMAVRKSGTTGTPDPYSVTYTDNQDAGDNETWNDSKTLLSYPTLSSKNDIIGFGAIMWDDDNGSITSRRTTFANNVKSSLSSISPSSWTGNNGPGAKLFGYAKPYSSTSIWSTKDELIDHGSNGYVQDLYTRSNRWGVPCPSTGSRSLWYKTPGNNAWWYVTLSLVLP